MAYITRFTRFEDGVRAAFARFQDYCSRAAIAILAALSVLRTTVAVVLKYLAGIAIDAWVMLLGWFCRDEFDEIPQRAQAEAAAAAQIRAAAAAKPELTLTKSINPAITRAAQRAASYLRPEPSEWDKRCKAMDYAGGDLDKAKAIYAWLTATPESERGIA